MTFKKNVLSLAVCVLVSCTSSKAVKWNEGEKRQFIENCNVTFKESLGADKVNKYCECLMEKMQDKGIKAEESNKIPTEIMTEAAEDCGL